MGAVVDHTSTLAGKRMAAGVLLRDAAGRVLLVEPTYKDYWELPGGAVDGDESPLDAAVRELKEELGLLVRVSRLLVTDWVPPKPPRTEGVMFVFDGGILDRDAVTDIALPPEELRSWSWCTPDEVQARMSPLLARRVRAAVAAAGAGTTRYLHDGRPMV